MLRRLALGCAPVRPLSAVAAAATAARTVTTNGNAVQRTNNNNRRPRRGPLPPAFDVVHWSEEDVSKGHLLRVLYRDNFIVLEYLRQRPADAPAAAADADAELDEEDEAPAAAGQRQRRNRGETVATSALPPSYIARLLSVLEGRAKSADITSRYTTGTFAPAAGGAAHHYTLSISTRRPASSQQFAADGADVGGEAIEWTVDFDAAESLMLHRFLTQALKYNTGFARIIN